MYTNELQYLNREAADYEDSLTDEEQDEIDEEAMQANIAAWNGAKLETKPEVDYLTMADLNGASEPF